MVPFLLPTAIIVFCLIAAALMLFLFGYQVARPGTALIVARPNSSPRVLFDGGAFSLPRHSEILELTPRTVRVELSGGSELRFTDGAVAATLTARLSPGTSAADVLAISRSLGAAVANDAEQLGRRLEPRLRELAQRCAETRSIASVADTSLAGALRAELAGALEGFSVESCEVTRSTASEEKAG